MRTSSRRIFSAIWRVEGFLAMSMHCLYAVLLRSENLQTFTLTHALWQRFTAQKPKQSSRFVTLQVVWRGWRWRGSLAYDYFLLITSEINWDHWTLKHTAENAAEREDEYITCLSQKPYSMYQLFRLLWKLEVRCFDKTPPLVRILTSSIPVYSPTLFH